MKRLLFVCFVVMLGISWLWPALDSEEKSHWYYMPNIPTSNNLRALFGSSWKDIWAVGDKATIIHYDGARWTKFPLQNIAPDDPDKTFLVNGWSLSKDDAWIVGNYNNKEGRIYWWNGKSWQFHTRFSSKRSKMSAIAFTEKNHGLVVGPEGLLFEWCGTKWDWPKWAWKDEGIANAMRNSSYTDIDVHPVTKAYYITAQMIMDEPGAEIGLNVDRIGEDEPHDVWSIHVRESDGLHTMIANYKTEWDISEWGIESGPVTKTFIAGPSKGGYIYQLNTGVSGHAGLSGIMNYSSYSDSPFPPMTKRRNHTDRCYDEPDFSFYAPRDAQNFWMVDKLKGWAVCEGGHIAWIEGGSEEDSYYHSEVVGSSNLNDIWMDGSDFGIIVGDSGTVLKLQRRIEGGELPRFSLKPEKRTYRIGEVVRYTVSKRTGPSVDLEGYTRMIMRGTTPVRTYSGSQYMKAMQAFNTGRSVTYEWDQKDDSGQQVEPGNYVIRFILKNKMTVALIEIEGSGVTSAQAAGREGGSIIFKTLADEYPPDRKVRFMLQNGTSKTLDLRGCRFIIERLASRPGETNWYEFYTSHPNFLSVKNLAPGQVAEWDWDRYDNEHENFGKGGSWRVKLSLPREQTGEIVYKFRLQR